MAPRMQKTRITPAGNIIYYGMRWTSLIKRTVTKTLVKKSLSIPNREYAGLYMGGDGQKY